MAGFLVLLVIANAGVTGYLLSQNKNLKRVQASQATILKAVADDYGMLTDSAIQDSVSSED